MIRLGLAILTAATMTWTGAALASAEQTSAPAAPAAPAPAPAAPAAAVPAAPAPAAPAPAAPAAQKIPAVVKSVEGTVESRPAIGQPWTAVKDGMQLAEGADLRTGFRAKCVLDMTDGLVQVGPLTVIRIGELRQEGGNMHARILMKQGSAQAEVAKKAVASDFAIVTPSVTLSVRGTRGIRCSYFPDLGGQYDLTQSGLIQVTSATLGNSMGVHPGEGTNDSATLPVRLVALWHEPPVLDLWGLTPGERWAAMRWNTSTPSPAALNGPSGSPGLLVLQSLPNEHPYPPVWPK
jgi:hypothetical protein